MNLSLGRAEDRRSLFRSGAIQFVIAIYGGYYGAGAGIMMLAVLALLGMTNIHAMNGFKTLLSVAFNGAAVVMFILKGIVLLAAGVVHDGRGDRGRLRRRVARAADAARRTSVGSSS